MQLGRRLGQHRRPVRRARAVISPQVAEQVDHHRRPQEFHAAQRQVAHCPRVLLELARQSRVERQVPRVVRPRGQLVDHDPPVARQEHLHGEQPLHVQRLRHGAGEFLGLAQHVRGEARWADRHVEDVAGVDVLEHGERLQFTPAVACADHRKLRVKLHPTLQHAAACLAAAPLRPGVGRGEVGGDLELALAVVAAAGRLEHAGRAQRRDGVGEFAGTRHDAKRRVREAVAVEKRFLTLPVLADFQRRPAGVHRAETLDDLQGGRGNVLELVRRHVQAARERLQRRRVVEARADRLLADRGGGSVCARGVKGAQPIAHAAGGEGGHARELPATEQADQGTRRNHGRMSRVCGTSPAGR